LSNDVFLVEILKFQFKGSRSETSRL